MTRVEFEKLVVEAIDSLPEEFQEQLNNVDVVIEDLPSQHQLALVGLTHPLSLFGLYQGIPKPAGGFIIRWCRRIKYRSLKCQLKPDTLTRKPLRPR
jgi:hypothetical protein